MLQHNNSVAKIPADVILNSREQCHELDLRCDQHVSHLHLVLLGHLDACLHDGDKTARSKQKQNDRSRTRLSSTFHGITVCVHVLHFINGISRKVIR